MKAKILSLIVTMMMLTLFVGCSEQTSTQEKKTIKFGTNANNINIVEGIVPEIEKMGYTVNVKMFDDPVSVDTATMEGVVDINFYQHKPYMDNFNKANNAKLIMLEPYIGLSLMGMASNRYTSLDEIPDGAKISMAQDASNKDRALRLLNDNGLLTLSSQNDNYSYTPIDIIDNPKKIQLVEMDLPSLLASLDDLDCAIFNLGYLITAGRTLDNVICYSKDQMRFPLGVVVDEKYKDQKWAADVMKAFTSDTAYAVLQENWKDSCIITFRQ